MYLFVVIFRIWAKEAGKKAFEAGDIFKGYVSELKMPVQGAWDGPGETNPPPGPEREEQEWLTAQTQIPTVKHG